MHLLVLGDSFCFVVQFKHRQHSLCHERSDAAPNTPAALYCVVVSFANPTCSPFHVQAILIVLPASATLALLARVEAVNAKILHKMEKYKLILAEELARYDSGEQVLSSLGKQTDQAYASLACNDECEAWMLFRCSVLTQGSPGLGTSQA